MKLKNGRQEAGNAGDRFGVCYQSSSNLQCGIPPLCPQAIWQSQVFKLLCKDWRVGANLTLGVSMFQKVGARAQKSLLESNSQSSLTDRIHSRCSDGCCCC